MQWISYVTQTGRLMHVMMTKIHPVGKVYHFRAKRQMAESLGQIAKFKRRYEQGENEDNNEKWLAFWASGENFGFLVPTFGWKITRNPVMVSSTDSFVILILLDRITLSFCMSDAYGCELLLMNLALEVGILALALLDIIHVFSCLVFLLFIYWFAEYALNDNLIPVFSAAHALIHSNRGLINCNSSKDPIFFFPEKILVSLRFLRTWYTSTYVTQFE